MLTSSFFFSLAVLSRFRLPPLDCGGSEFRVSCKRWTRHVPLFRPRWIQSCNALLLILTSSSRSKKTDFNFHQKATMATALKCPGFPTLVINLGLPDIQAPNENDKPISEWLHEYIKAASLEPYGFLPDKRFYSKTFKEASIAMGKEVFLNTVFASKSQYFLKYVNV